MAKIKKKIKTFKVESYSDVLRLQQNSIVLICYVNVLTQFFAGQSKFILNGLAIGPTAYLFYTKFFMLLALAETAMQR